MASLEKKLTVGHWDSMGRKTGGTDSGRRAARDKKRSVKKKIDKILARDEKDRTNK